MPVIQLPSQRQMRDQYENHKTASPQLHFPQETLSNSFIFLMSCIILDPILRLLLLGNDSKGSRKKTKNNLVWFSNYFVVLFS